MSRCLAHKEQENRGAGDDREDADSGDRTVRRTDQSGHIPADPGDQEPDDEDEDYGETQSVVTLFGASGVPAMNRRESHAGECQTGNSEANNPAGTEIMVPLVAGCRCSRRGERGDQATDNWFGELGQRPQRCDHRSCRRR